MARQLEHSQICVQRPAQVFKALTTPSAIRQWWSASRAIVIPANNGVYDVAWGPEDDPEYVSAAVIKLYNPPHQLQLHQYRYASQDGPLPFDATIEVHFTLEPHPEGTVITVVQSGFPDDSSADDFYAACQKGWRDTLRALSEFVAHQ